MSDRLTELPAVRSADLRPPQFADASPHYKPAIRSADLRPPQFADPSPHYKPFL